MKMQIFYVLPEATSYRDIVDLGVVVDGALRWCKGRAGSTKKYRDEKKAREGELWFCHRCNKQLPASRMDIHHIKPVWVIILEEILAHPPRNVKEYVELVRVVRAGVLRFDVTDDDSGYFAVCKHCHHKQERGIRGLWQDRFEKNHPVVFREMALWNISHQSQFKKIVRSNNGDPYWPVPKKRKTAAWR